MAVPEEGALRDKVLETRSTPPSTSLLLLIVQSGWVTLFLAEEHGLSPLGSCGGADK